MAVSTLLASKPRANDLPQRLNFPVWRDVVEFNSRGDRSFEELSARERADVTVLSWRTDATLLGKRKESTLLLDDARRNEIEFQFFFFYLTRLRIKNCESGSSQELKKKKTELFF